MKREPTPDLQTLLAGADHGDATARETLWRLVYDELHRLAHSKLANLGPGGTLQTTALVHEVYLRLGGTRTRWEGEGHFFGAAARAMRNVLVDAARRKARTKRGGGLERIGLSEELATVEPRGIDLLALDDALDRLAEEQPRVAQVVSLRFFAGLTIEDAARALKISTATVERDWQFARAWLQVELEAGGNHPDT